MSFNNCKDECTYNYALSLQTVLSQCKIKKMNYMTYNTYTISTFQSMYKAEKKRYNEHNPELVQS